MRYAFDSNILVYAEDWGDAKRCKAARALIARLDPADGVLPVQALGELFNVLVRKAGRAPNLANRSLLDWSDSYEVVDTSQAALLAAGDLVATHDLQLWDALTICVSAKARCRVLLSEDMQDGFTWQGVTVVNPFAKKPHALLGELLA